MWTVWWVPPAANNREDVLLVQFISSVIGSSPPPSTDPALLVAAEAVKVTGTIDGTTINAIRTQQEGMRRNGSSVHASCPTADDLASVIFDGGLRLLESRAPAEPLLTRPETRGCVFTADEKD
jgi:hypothetical protein